MTNITLADLQAQYLSLKDEIDGAVSRVLESGRFVNGPEKQSFEENFEKYLGCNHAVGVGNGTDAITLALLAMGVGPGDDVILPANTFQATAEAVVFTGARPVLCDVDPATALVDATSIEKAWTDKSRAVIPVHLYGYVAPMNEIIALANEKGALVLEDAAQAHGATLSNKNAGTFGQMAAFSFFPGKALGAYGDGGMIVTDDEDLAGKARAYGNHGRSSKYAVAGSNSRLDEIQAAILNVKLKHLDGWIARRSEIETIYRKGFAGVGDIEFLSPGENVGPAPLNVVCTTEQRDDLLNHLKAKGIFANVHYKETVHLQPGYRYLGYEKGDFPASENLCDKVISLPNYPEMTDEQMDTVISIVIDFFA